MSNQFVWWVRPEEIGIALGSLAIPGWLIDQLVSAHGRNGRGRLWIARHLVEVSIDEPWPETPLAKHCETCAGIVVTIAELATLQDFPGVVTNLQLRRAP
jgi:hypothetical protein